MKKLFTFIAVICLALNASAQYQVENSDFEEWESVSDGAGEEPVKWSSFLTPSDGTLAMAKGKQLESSTHTRPGSTGTKSAYIYARKVFLAIYAQGNLTTGCISGTSTTATNANGNYNFTNESNSGQCMKFSGKPDAIKVWVNNYTSVSGRTGKIAVYLHEKGYYQDPNTGNTGKLVKLVASATKSPASNSNSDKENPKDEDWHEVIIPFTYENNGTDRPFYALVSFATNSTMGQGASNDYMYIDDMEMVYYHELTSAKYNGNALSFVNNEVTLDNVYYDKFDKAKLTDIVLKGVAAHHDIADCEVDVSEGKFVFTVYGDDYGTNESLFKNPNSKTTYTIKLKKYDKGDVNKDGSVTIADVTALVNMILGKAEKNEMANINGDGDVTIADVTALVNIILGKN